MKEQLKEELVARFREYLETDFAPDSEEEYQDRYSLFSELSGLKNEVRIESRHFKSALDDFRGAFSVLDGANQDLAKSVQLLQNQKGEQEHQMLQPFVTGLMDLYDRLLAGLERKLPKQHMFQAFYGGNRHKRWFDAHQEGQEMALNRILDLLTLCDITPIDINNTPFNPGIMRAVQFKTDSGVENGIVLEECRKGFVRGTQVVRPAEVIVNKREE